MGTIDLTELGNRIDITNPRDLSIDFVKKAYELIEYSEEHPYDYEGMKHYLVHGYSLKLAGCKSPTELKHCNFTLIKNSTIKAQTYMDKDINLGIAKLLGTYLKLLKKDKAI